MKITAVETTPVRVRRLRAYGTVTRTALGSADISEHGVVQVHTDEGLTGLGELSSVFARRGPLLCRDVDERLGPVLVGRDPLAITGALRTARRGARRGAIGRGRAGGDRHRSAGERGSARSRARGPYGAHPLPLVGCRSDRHRRKRRSSPAQPRSPRMRSSTPPRSETP